MAVSRQTLTEVISPVYKPLIVEGQGTGNLFLSGLFIQGNVKNHNGRVYPLSEISRAVQTLTEKISTQGGVLGELDHPEGLQIGLGRTSHAITEIRLDGPNGVGKMRILGDTNPNAAIVRSIIEAGVQLGVSSRGSGSVGNDGRVSEFEIITIDIVANPSAPDAHPRAIIESLMGTRYGGEAYRLAEYLRDDRSAQKYFKREMEKFLLEHRDEFIWRKG
jgi:hypothetical protein